MQPLRSLILTLAVTLTLSTAIAQTGSIQGTVTDSGGGVVPNARVTATDLDKGIIARETKSSKDGSFVLTPLLPGHYDLKIEMQGFKTYLGNNLTLDQNQVMALGALTLQVGQLSDSVAVEAEIPVIETATSQKSFVISSKEVTELPLNGRDFMTLMRTLPGVVTNNSSDFRLVFNNTDQFNVNGMRGSANNVFLDGAINTDLGANDGQYTQVSLDAVGEFKVQTSAFNAEYGRNPGVMISVNTKSGGSTFHGTGYEFIRNDAFDANSFFRNAQSQSRAKLRFDQFGGNLSGPVIIPKFSSGDHKKLFFFFNYEGTRATRPLNNNTFIDIPSGQVLTGDLSQLFRPGNIISNTGADTGFRNGTVFQPGTVVRDSSGRAVGGTPYPGNVIPVAQWNRNAPSFIKMLNFISRAGAPQTPGIPEQVRVPFQPTYLFNKNAKVARVDYAISPKMNFFFRWADDAQRENQDIGIFSSLPYPIYPQYRKKPGSSWSWNLASVISPHATNEFIWYSERDDWGHLYLYDATTGKLKNQITKGAFVVTQLLKIDETNRTLYFLANGHEPGRDPYFAHFYSIKFDGSKLTLLTPEDGNHTISLSPDGKYFTDNYSKPDVPPVSVLRDMQGRLIAELEKTDISKLTATGWRPPESIKVK